MWGSGDVGVGGVGGVGYGGCGRDKTCNESSWKSLESFPFSGHLHLD